MYPSAVPTDPVSLHLVKQQLFQKCSDPFSGSPEKFHSWLNSLNNKTSGLHLTPWDHLLILQANTDKEALSIINKHMSIGGADPSIILNNVMSELKFEYGSSVKIANSLIDRLESFPVIKHVSNSTKLKELLTLCQHIEANMLHTNDLTYFNTGYGSRNVWLKLPDPLQCAFRSASDDYRVKKMQIDIPLFPLWFSFFVRSAANCPTHFSNDNIPHPKLKKREPIVLKTELNVPVAKFSGANYENDSTHENNERHECPLHEKGNHPLSDCKKFAKLPHKEKFSVLKRYRLCFRCLGKHMKSACTSALKCSTCQGDHASLLHFEPKPKNNVESEQHLNHDKTSLRTTSHLKNSDEIDCSKVVLVDVWSKSRSKTPLRCYAILDDQSDSSYADPKLADYFEFSSICEYGLRTLQGSTTEIEGIVVDDLVVKGVKEKNRYALPSMSTNPFHSQL